MTLASACPCVLSPKLSRNALRLFLDYLLFSETYIMSTFKYYPFSYEHLVVKLRTNPLTKSTKALPDSSMIQKMNYLTSVSP